MEKLMKAERLWDSLATKWDKPGVSLGENDYRIIEKSRKYLNTGSTVLDYGCATGSIALELAKTVKEVHGVDISTKMIDTAKKKAGERASKNTVFLQGTLFNEGLKEKSYDVILASSILHLVKDTPQVFNRIHSLLKPGGIFISATPCLGAKKPVSIMINIPVYILSKAGVLPIVNFFTGAKLADLMARANFQVLDKMNLSDRAVNETFIAAKKI
jgi:2-polyprenyl-3-methyl-5-hydroxy-6-metoxy-1,4-benzoquinol methylase